MSFTSERDYDESPFIVIWEMTRACALRCVHCRAEAQYRRDPRELTTEEGKRLLEQIAALDHPMLVLTGGDPFQRGDLFELAEYGIEQGLHVSLAPSATPKVTKKRLEQAKRIGISRISFSLDGSTAEIHDRFRGFKGTYDRTMHILEMMRELELSLQINTTVSRYNLDDLDPMVKLLMKKDVVLWSLFFLVPTGRGKSEDMITPEQHEQVFEWLYDVSRQVPFGIKTTAAPHYRRLVMQRKIKSQGVDGRGTRLGTDVLGRFPKGVNDGNGFVFISHIGDVNPSGFLPIRAGNVREQPLAKIYRDSFVFQQLRNPDRYRGKCGVCEFRYICGGSRARAYAVTGDYMASDPYCTYMPQRYAE